MARQALFDRPDEKVVRSVLQFHQDDEELFLLFSRGRQNGPGIERDGRSSPWMSHPSPDSAHLHITDPDLQRWGTWFLDPTVKEVDQKKLRARIAKLEELANEAVPGGESEQEHLGSLKDLLADNAQRETYLEEFSRCYPGHEVVAVQGMGDLTMNHWNVAYLRSEFCDAGDGQLKSEILHLLDEPIHDRVYTCLIKWRDPARNPRYEIREVRFNRFVFNSDETDPRVVMIDGEAVADKIEFAVYGQQLIKPRPEDVDTGLVFDPKEIVHQFSDVRHLFQLVNLNPKGPLGTGSSGPPRYYFGQQQKDDIWFGEAELLDNRNLRRAALADSIELNRLYLGLGASLEQVDAAMTASGYTRNKSTNKMLAYKPIPEFQDRPGATGLAEWRVVEEDKSLVEVRMRENRYPCTLIGVDSVGGFTMSAWKGTYSKYPGWTLRQAAYNLSQYGTNAAILCDEGGDVFQYYRPPGADLKPVISPSRGQMRAVFIVARKKNDGTQA